MNIEQLTGSGGIPQSLPAPRVTGSASPPGSTPPPEPERVRQAVDQIQRAVPLVAQNLQFLVEKATGKTIVRVVDSQTREVIRQIPTEEVLSIARALDRMQGLLFNRTV